MREQPTFKGRSIELVGGSLQVGDFAPQVAVAKGDLSNILVGGATGRTQLLIAVLSIDTPVCAEEARSFNAKCAMLEGVDAFLISVDLPFALGRFASTDGMERLTLLSDFRERALGRAYGVLCANDAIAGLLARSVFVVAPDGKIAYREIVGELSASEPNYDAALGAAREAAQQYAALEAAEESANEEQ